MANLRMLYLAAASAVLVCLRIASAADDDEAAFGLRWSQSESELKSAGVIPPGAKRETLHGSARRYLVGRLPGSFADVEDCSLSFNTSGELAKIFCAGKNIEDDPYGTAMKSRYDELKALVSERFGKPRSFEHQDDLWADRNEWWMSLKTKRSSWDSFWVTDAVAVLLEVKALSVDSGYYAISIEHKQRWHQVHEGNKQKQKERF